jgi:hypothetical protein
MFVVNMCEHGIELHTQPQNIDTLCDSFAANNCQYFYCLKGYCHDGSTLYSAIKNITTPDILIPVCGMRKPFLLIDKANYILELYIDSVCVKKCEQWYRCSLCLRQGTS